MTFTDIMLANHKATIGIRKLNHIEDENIILKFETDHSLGSVFLNIAQAQELLKRLKEILATYESAS